MKYLYIIIFSLIGLVLIKVMQIAFRWLLRKIELIISSLILYPCLFLGIGYAAFLTNTFSQGNDPLGFVSGIIFIMILFVGFTIFYLCERVGEYIKNESKFWKFILSVFLVLFSFSLNFAVQYFLLFLYNPDSFENVPENNVFVEFTIFSFGIISNTTVSSILTSSLISRLVACVEVLTSFILLVVVLSNYQEIGKLMNRKSEDK